MQVSRAQGSSNQAFKSLFIAKNLANKVLYTDTSTKFLSDFVTIRNYVIANKLDSKKYVDIILDEKDNIFSATISSKGQGIPYSPNNIVAIEKVPMGVTKSALAKFKKWVNNWNHAYNPKTLEKFSKIDKLIKDANWDNTPVSKALKEMYE